MSLFSFLRTLTAWYCPQSPATAAQRRTRSHQSISAARRALSGKPAAACLLVWALAGTDSVPLHTLLTLHNGSVRLYKRYIDHNQTLFTSTFPSLSETFGSTFSKLNGLRLTSLLVGDSNLGAGGAR